MGVVYEWQIESVDAQDDICATVGYPTFNDMMQHYQPVNATGTVNRCVLIRSEYRGARTVSRSWAYVQDGKLPTWLDSIDVANCYRVPDRLRREAGMSS